MLKNKFFHIYTIDFAEGSEMNIFIKIYHPDHSCDFYERLQMRAMDLFPVLEKKGINDPDIKKILEWIKAP